ncbi:MAG: hypothetical protein ABSE48_22740 [Verrucomicrobiota bacterium]
METNGLTKILVVEDDVHDSFLLTHQLAKAQIDDLVTLGVTAYLPKPVGLATFIKTVAHFSPKITIRE